MINIIFTAIYGLAIGYGTGVRVSLYLQRKEAKRLNAEFMAKAAEIDERIAKAGH